MDAAKLCTVLAVSLLVGFACGSTGPPRWYPSRLPLDKDVDLVLDPAYIGQWAQTWYQWAALLPASQNPWADLTGAKASAGNPVGFTYLLVGAFPGSTPVVKPITRTIRVSKSIRGFFLPILNNFLYATDAPTATSDLYENGYFNYTTGNYNWWQQFLNVYGSDDTPYIAANGKSPISSATVRRELFVSPPLFPVIAYKNNLFGTPDNFGTSKEWLTEVGATAGYYAYVDVSGYDKRKPLTLRFGGKLAFNGFQLKEIKYKIYFQ